MIDDLWRWLTTVRAFDLVIRSQKAGDPLHQGAGRITVEGDSRVITWHEQGEWVTGPLARIRFTNTTRWEQLGAAAISVSHQRRGPAPLLLSTLRPTGAGEWTGDPHLCGDDHYRPTLVSAVDHLFLAWDVASPTDPYRWEMTAR